MKVLYSPVIINKTQGIKFNGESIQIEVDGEVYMHDFSTFTDGQMTLTTTFINRAQRVDGVLFVEIVKYVSENASDSEFYPDWETIEDATDVLDTNIQTIPIAWITKEEIEQQNAQPSQIEKLRIEQAQANAELVQLIMMMGGA